MLRRFVYLYPFDIRMCMQNMKRVYVFFDSVSIYLHACISINLYALHVHVFVYLSTYKFMSLRLTVHR